MKLPSERAFDRFMQSNERLPRMCRELIADHPSLILRVMFELVYRDAYVVGYTAGADESQRSVSIILAEAEARMLEHEGKLQ